MFIFTAYMPNYTIDYCNCCPGETFESEFSHKVFHSEEDLVKEWAKWQYRANKNKTHEHWEFYVYYINGNDVLEFSDEVKFYDANCSYDSLHIPDRIAKAMLVELKRLNEEEKQRDIAKEKKLEAEKQQKLQEQRDRRFIEYKKLKAEFDD